MTNERDISDRVASLSRRKFVAGAGVLAVGGAGATVALTADDAGTDRFLARQGMLRYEVTPLGDGETTVETFYDYRGTDAHPPEGLVADPDTSRLFLYHGPVSDSLVFLHGSADAEHGGTADFELSGLSRERGEWAVRDDPRSVADDFERWDEGNARVVWEWGAGDTDGGAFWGGFDRQDFEVSVTPKAFSGVDSWRLLTGEATDPTRHGLVMDRPCYLRPARDRSVERANVEVMPDTDPNEFDPYAEERLTVAVNPPPADADADEWVDPASLDPGNYSLYFGSKPALARGEGAQPQNYRRVDGSLELEYVARAAGFDLESAHGYLAGKAAEKTFVRGRDTVRPGGFDNSE
jgi:hypothetical protein